MSCFRRRIERCRRAFGVLVAGIGAAALLAGGEHAVAWPGANPRTGVFHVVPADSFVGYRVRERLSFLPARSDAVGRTSVIVGSAQIDGDVLTATSVSTDTRTLKSDQSRRDGAVRSLLLHMPVATFRLTKPVRLPRVPDGATFRFGASADLRLHGVERHVVFPIRARWSDGRLEVVTSLQILFADYRIKRPKFGPVLSVSPRATIEVQLSFARA